MKKPLTKKPTNSHKWKSNLNRKKDTNLFVKIAEKDRRKITMKTTLTKNEKSKVEKYCIAENINNSEFLRKAIYHLLDENK